MRVLYAARGLKGETLLTSSEGTFLHFNISNDDF